MSKYKGFTQVSLREPKRSLFDLSHERRVSTRMGRLTPILVLETMPNDTFRINSEVMLRLAPLLAPIMHRVNVFVHFFYVPNRILWSGWEAFITGGRLGTETPPVPPYFDIGAVLTAGQNYFAESKLADYMGIPPLDDADAGDWIGRRISCMPFAAFSKVYEDYYRDRNFVNDTTAIPMAAGANTSYSAFLTTRTRCWQHDYFTSALPWTQRGDEVLMPLQGTGTVSYLDPAVAMDGGVDLGNIAVGADVGGIAPMAVNATTGATVIGIKNVDEVQLTTSDVSINDFRTAIQLQSWLERNALAGSRYAETIMAHFHRKTSDGRLQRAEYLGGGKVNVQISEVVTTAFSDDGSDIIPAGNMAGHGISFGKMNRVRYNCEEHGFVIGVMSVMPTSAYMQGLPRMYRARQDYLDYPWPSFAHLGEQEVKTWEIYFDDTNCTTDPDDDPVFGYQSRYADWKHCESAVAGAFRSSLDFWHVSRKFASSPVLGNTFVHFEDDLQDRIFAVSEVDTLWCYIYNQVTVMRSLPYFGQPANIA